MIKMQKMGAKSICDPLQCFSGSYPEDRKPLAEGGIQVNAVHRVKSPVYMRHHDDRCIRCKSGVPQGRRILLR